MARKYPHPVFGWDRIKLAELTLGQLSELRQFVIADPANDNQSGGINLYTKGANAKLDALAWAVANRMRS